jgi:glycosyltransferase involved in cell wall biosynthesis
MRIAYVLTSLGMGGAERQGLALAERMAARGHAVSLVVLRSRQPEEWPTSLHLIRLDMRKNPLSLLAGLAKARRFLRAFNPDLIHSHTYPANIAARLLKIFFPSAAVLSTIHNVYEGPWPRILAYRLTDPLCRHTTAVSQAAADRSVRLKALPARKSSVLTNGIDTAEFAPSPERRARLRAQRCAQEEFVWLAAGRIVPAKDFPNLLRAFALVRATVPEAQLWIAGEGAGDAADIGEILGENQETFPSGAKARLSSAAFSARLKSCPNTSRSPECVFPQPVKPIPFTESSYSSAYQVLAIELGLGASVRWLGLRRDMPALLDAADGFVLASAWEGMPLALGEAMAMEKPVVATDVGGVRELVGEAGVIVPAKSPDALAQAMLALMRSTPEARRSLGRAARERILKNFSMDAKADEWEALYRTLLAQKI